MLTSLVVTVRKIMINKKMMIRRTEVAPRMVLQRMMMQLDSSTKVLRVYRRKSSSWPLIMMKKQLSMPMWTTDTQSLFHQWTIKLQEEEKTSAIRRRSSERASSISTRRARMTELMRMMSLISPTASATKEMKKTKVISNFALRRNQEMEESL